MTDDELAELERLAEAATPNWRTGRKVGRTLYKGYDDGDLIGVMDTRADAAFAAAAREAVPKLIAEVRRLRQGQP